MGRKNSKIKIQQELDEEEEEDEEVEEENHGDTWKEPALTEYERERLERVQRNREALKCLGVTDLLASVAPRTSISSSVSLQDGKGSGALRRSSRLSGRVGELSTGDNKLKIRARYEEPDNEGSGNSKKRAKGKCVLQWDDQRKDRQEEEEYVPSWHSQSDDSSDDTESEEESPKRSIVQSQPKKRKSLSRRAEGDFRARSESFELPFQQTPDVVMDDDELILQQAIALSLGSSYEPDAPIKGASTQAGPAQQGNRSRKLDKKKTKRTKDPIFTREEIDTFFQVLAGPASGRISLRDLERAASVHDFTWSKEELLDMIQFFDKDGDNQLDLVDFRDMAERCRMMQL